MSLEIRAFEHGGVPTPKKPVIVFLHGYGSNEQDLAGLINFLPPMPWVSLRAPIALQPASYAWAPITVPGNPEAGPVEEVTRSVWNWIDVNLPEDSLIIPIGFSQGGMMATQLLRTRPERVLTTVVLAGFTLGHPQPADDAVRQELPPVIYCRGLDDQVISPSAVARTAEWLGENTTLTAKTYYRLGHSIDERVMQDVHDFLKSI